MSPRTSHSPAVGIARILAWCLLVTMDAIHPCPSVASLLLDGFAEVNYYPEVEQPRQAVINQQRLRVNVVGSAGGIRLMAWLETRKNGSGRLRPKWELRIPEVYAEYQRPWFFARIGKQQIVWGDADGLFVNDVANPLDLREFLLPDLHDVRLGQPGLRLQVRRNNWLAETLWIWRFAETQLPKIPVEDISLGAPLEIVCREPQKPASTIRNSEVGVRISGLVGAWDVSLNYLRSWRDIATYRGQVAASEESGAAVLELAPYYQRVTTWGGCFSRPLGQILLRGEFSLIPGLHLERKDLDARSHDFLAYFVGADFRVQKATVGIQLAQEAVFGNTDELMRKHVDSVVTLMVKKSFAHDRLHWLVFVDEEFDQHDRWFRTEVGCRLNNRLRLTCGVHVFGGKVDGRLGRYHCWNSGYVRVRYSFSV